MNTYKKFLKRVLSGFIAAAMCIMNMAGVFDPGDIRNMMKVLADDTPPGGDSTFRITGTVEFHDIFGNDDWSELVRPSEFDQKIVVVLQYKDNNNELKEIRNYAQDDIVQEPFYLKFVHDGNGAGNFTVEKVPRKVTVDGAEYAVTGCYVEAGIDSEKYPYYENRASDDSHNNNIEPNITTFYKQIDIDLIRSALKLNPVVLPENSADASFEMDVTLINGTKTIQKKYNAPSEILVPVGIDFSIVQNQTKTENDGFKFDGSYTVTEGADDAGTKYQDKAEGTIKSGVTTTVTTTNYNQNLKKEFRVLWVDNQSTSRPQTNANLFDIMYTTDGGSSWQSVYDENNDMDIDLNNLKFNEPSSESEDHTMYSFTGLPSVINNKDGEEIGADYKIVPKEPYPDGYMVTQDGNTITFIEKSDFTATIKWNDAYSKDKRPDVNTVKSYLKLKRSLGNGSESEDIDMSKVVIEESPENDDLWIIRVDGLERYDTNNHEYDYYIECVSEIKEGDITLKHYIDNAGNYHADTEKCHNGGTIIEVLSDVYPDDFKASIEWKDPGTDGVRPDPTVTLWRYVETPDIDGPDEAYDSGSATQVIFQKNNEDKIVSYTMQPGNSNIIFNSTTVSDLPSDYKLPMYDDHGNRYVYFVRESLSGNNDDKYEIVNNSAPADGVISNVRREKAAVNIKKIWKNPEGLDDIDGASVQLALEYKSDSNETKPLTVYSPENRSYEKLTGTELKNAQTIKGFSPMIPSLEVTYYVNICDDNGNHIDMSNISIAETVLRDRETFSYHDDADNNNYISVNGNTYKTETKYTVPFETLDDGTKKYSPIILADGTEEYRYTQTNTIFAYRDYEVEKVWGSGIKPEDYANIKSINFSIERCLLKDLAAEKNASYEKVKNIEVPYASDSNNWIKDIFKSDKELLKYDPDGYEYYYRAVEKSFNMSDGSNKNIGDFQNWATLYHRTPDKTQAVNYVPTGGGGYFTITKNWQDNGDKSHRPDIRVIVCEKDVLKTKLEALNTDDIVPAAVIIDSMAKFDNKPEAGDILLKSEKSYTAEFSYPDGKTREQYITLEYMVGDEVNGGAKPAEYKAGELLAFIDGQTQAVYGKVENSSRAYKVGIIKDSAGDVFISNTRTGVTNLKVSKAWKDGENDTYRPSNIQFRLYLNDKEYSPDSPVPASVYIDGSADELDYDTGIINVDVGNDGNWNFEIKDLPMFSDSGMVNYYNIEEEPITEKNGVNYISKKEDVKPGEGSDHQTQNIEFNFSNTAVGTIDYTVYKKWNDKSVKPEDRPDIYFSLYRWIDEYDENGNLKPANRQLVTDCEDQIWTADPVVSGNEKYDWKITVPDLPRFDINGNEYKYVFTERINNNGVTVFGTYKQKKEENFVTDADGKHDLFINTITGEVEITGKKTWSGLAKYYKSNSDLNSVLPDPLIELYRGSEEQPFRTTSLNSEKTKYIFSNLPRYDDNGERYIYTVKEKFEDGVTKQLYTTQNQNGTLQNIFRDDINRRKIEVTKKWKREDIKSSENKYPSVTYKLYRYEEGTDISAAELLETIKIPSSDFNSADGEKTVVFDDLLVCSPRGKDYYYYVTEECGINGKAQGYTIEYYDENNNKQDANRVDISNENINPYEANSENNKKSISTLNNYNLKGNVTLTGDKEWDDYSNLYGMRPEVSEFNLSLKRYTENESGQTNKVQNDNVIYQTHGVPLLESKEAPDAGCSTPYIVWSGTNTDKWTYTIYNLERYAPNGMPYIYVLSEDSVPGYKKAGDAAKIKEDSAEGITQVSMKQMTNSFDGSCEVRKNWFDGYNKYNLRPDNITVVLQKKIEGVDPDFVDVEFKPEMDGKLPGEYTDPGDDKTLVSKTLTVGNAIKNTKNNSSWGFTFNNLPLVDSSGHKISYRCREVMIGGVAVDDKGIAGSYKSDYIYDTENKPIIENTLDDTSLEITKEWIGDSDNIYGSRPESLQFKLQKKGTRISGDTQEDFDWTDVTVDGKSTFTISADDNWQMTLNDLPVAQIIKDSTGNQVTVYTLYYRAVEVTKEKTINDSVVKVIEGAENYEDITQESDHSRDINNVRNESKIKNKLILNEPSVINVSKQWYSVSTGANAVLELQYKTTDESEEKWHSYSPERLIETSECTGINAQTFNWTGLPKYDRDGKELEYRVIEDSISGYKIDSSYDEETKTWSFTNPESGYKIDNSYDEETNTWSFTNTELQSYTVNKIWKNADYAHKDGDSFTAEFKLQQSVDSENWVDTTVDSEGKTVESIILKSDAANDEKSDTWANLPKYDSYGREIKYRAVETKINGIDVENNSNGDYIVTYSYDGTTATSFGGTETTATNRMIYGFVNLSKAAAYLNPNITDADANLEDVVFDIYRGDDTETPYVSGIKTSAEGKLIRNNDGTYGKEHRYLITGEYTLMETSTNPDFSVWDSGVSFTVGNTGGTTDTGEHGTAWIYTENNEAGNGMKLSVEYKHADISKNHLNETGDNICTPYSDTKKAYNIESRGVIELTKTGENGKPLDTHSSSSGESNAYFGVYKESSCLTQVAGLIADSSDKTKFVLTDKKADSTTLSATKDGIPYLRNYNGENGFSLLSGDYYIKEIVAPAGYKLDTTVHKAVISHLGDTPVDSSDIGALYGSNRAVIEGLNNNNWPNTPNKVTVYKMDQYGRKVDLNGKNLVLSIQDGSKLPGNVQSYDLYQDTTHDNDFIKYDGTDKSWTITGLLDINNTYTLSEPDASVPDKNVKAVNVVFTVDAAGNMVIQSNDPDVSSAKAVSNPLEADGDDYENYYKADTNNNIVVMRDASRYFKNVVLEKHDSVHNEILIPNISFELYRYDSFTDGQYTGVRSVLEDGVLLTTDADGRIDLSTIENVTNRITGCEIKYGLDMGNYYFKEVERGASDKYRLLNEVRFRIEANSGNHSDYDDYARVVYEDFTENQVQNDPVTKYPKTLNLTKKDGETLLPGARFTLKYTSVNKGQPGADTDSTENCVTGADGELYIADRSWNATSVKPDISRKGTYVLEEIQASDYYMTPTYSKVKLTFKVDSNNVITVTENTGGLIATGNITEASLPVTAVNQKTVVKLSKLNDIYNQVKTKDQKDLTGEPLIGADLRIFEGTNEITALDTTKSSWTLTGILKENTEYILREVDPPVGYMAADDIKFRFFGTNAANESVLQVWNGTNWVASQNLDNNTLTMVDEAIIAPVDMQKVVGDSTYAKLPGAKFKVKAGEAELGTAVSDSNGWLVWESEPAKNGAVFNSSGKRAGSSDNLAGTKIILQQNTSGYTFMEIYAPDNAYNNGDSWTVKITAENYVEYKSNSNKYIDIKAANESTDKTVTSLSERNNTPGASDLVNPQYKSTVTLHKYDADEEGQNASIADTEFTLYRDSVSSGNIYKKAYNGTELNNTGVFRTDSNGNLSIQIREKGTYILKETKAATGYKLDSNNSFTFTLQDKSDAEEKAKNIFGYNETNSLKADGVPNDRIKGSVTLVKKDDKTGQDLNDVVYILTRTAAPVAPENYQLKEPAEVKTGHKYTAVKGTDGIWTLSETACAAGTLEIEGLNWSSYKLVEKTENSGYVLDQKELEFTISAESLNVNVTDEGKQYVSNVRNKVTFKKTNMEEEEIFTENDIKGLAGAVFEVRDSNNDIVEFYASETEKTRKVTEITSGADGTVTIYGLPTVQSAEDSTVTYKLVEKVAPKGYKLQHDPVEFTVDRLGNVKVAADVVNQVTMQDEAIKIWLKKFGEDNDALNGAVFELTDSNGEKLADGSDKLEITVDETKMIPVEKLIGGHSYTLTETQAPDGYECTAVVNFTVDEDGKVTDLTSAGGYKIAGSCASLDDAKTTISIRNEKIRAKIEKIDTEPGADNSTVKLKNVEFEITGVFEDQSGVQIKQFTTSGDGTITIPDGLLIHGNEYTIRETRTIEGYYIYKELSEGVKVTVKKDGTITVPSGTKHIKSSGTDISTLTIDNAKSASFEMTKKVEGNMGDLTGEFQIKMEVFEADGTYINDKTVTLRLNEKYDSINGKLLTEAPVATYESSCAFGTDAIPVGAKLVISEDNSLDYSAKLSIINITDNSHISEVDSDNTDKGTVTVILDSNQKFHFELVNTKNVIIDIGVKTENQSPLAVVAVMIPAAWLLMRSKTRRRRWVMS